MRKNLYRLLLLPLLLAAWGARAQAPAWLAATGVPVSNTGALAVQGVAVNTAGDVFVTGSYAGSATFGGTTLNSVSGPNSNQDIYVAKWNTSAGSWAWAVSAGGTDADEGYGIAVSGTSVYVTGSFTSSTGASIAGTSLAGAGSTDVFVAKYTDNGSSVTANGAVSGGGSSGDKGRGIAVSGTKVYVTGYINTTPAVTLSGTSFGAGAYGSQDAFLAKYNDAGTGAVHLQNGGAVRGGGTSVDRGNGVAVSGTNVYMVGYFNSSSATFGSSTLTNAGGSSSDIFVAKCTDTGTLTLAGAVSAGGAAAGATDRANGVAANGSTVYVVGSFGSPTITFGSSTLTNSDNTNNTTEFFVAKYTDTGAATLTANSAVGTGAGSNTTNISEDANAVAVSGATVYVAGTYYSPITIGSSTLPNAPGGNAFVAKYTDGGTLTANGAVAGGASDGSGAAGFAVVVNASNQAVTGGSFNTATTGTFGSFSTTGGGFFGRVGQPISSPTVTTATPATITTNGATLGGNVTNDGGATVTGRGVVYSTTNTAPTVGGTNTTTAANGSNTGTFSAAVAGLSPGTRYYVAAYATNSAGTSYGSVLQFVTTPNAPVVVTPANGSLTNDNTPAFVGTAQANSTVTVIVDGSSVGTTTADASSNWAFTQPTALSQGSHTVYATAAINGSAASAASNTNTFTVDTTPPAAPVVTAPANGSAVSATTPSYTGTAEASSTVTVIVDGSPIGTTTANASGNWSLTQPVALSQGSHTVRARASDGVGNVSTDSNTNTFTVDTVSPTVAISSSAGANGSTTTTSPIPFTVTFSESVTGFVAGDLTVTNGTVSGFSGSGTTYTFLVTPTGSGSTVTVNVAANVAQDQAGNGNNAATQFGITYQQPTVTVTSVTRLTPSPAATATVNYRVTFSGSVSGLTTSNFNLTTTGTLSGTGVATLSGSGTTYTVGVNTGLGDGTLRLNVANAAGVTPTISNVPYTGGEQYTITKTFAAAPTLRIQGIGSASGNSDVTAFVDQVQVLNALNGSAVAGGVQNGSFETNNVAASNYLYQQQGVVASPWTFGPQAGVARNGSAFGSTAADGDAVTFLQSAAGNNGNVSQNLAVPSGNYQVRFRAIQRNYTTLDQRLQVFVNDVFVGAIQPNNIPAYDNFTSDLFTVTAPALTATVSTTSASPTSTAPIPYAVSFSQSVGTSFTASDVTVAGGTLTSGSFSGSGSGPYTFTVTPAGTGTVTVSLAAGVAADANNTPNTASNAVSVQYNQPQTTAPLVVTPGNGSLTNNTYPPYSGTAPASSTITVIVDGSPIGTATTSAAGTWIFTATTPLADGSHTVRATAQLSGQAVSAASNTNTFTVDTTPPAAPVVTAPANGSIIASAMPTYIGTAEANATVLLIVDGSAVGTTTANASGNWGLTQTIALAQGSHTVRARATDMAGNPSVDSNTNTFTVDTAAPTVAISSTASNPTTTSPIPVTVTFSESVTGFVAGDLTVTGGTVSGFAGSGTTYTFSVTPAATTLVTVNVPANVAQDAAGNGNAAAPQFSIQYNQLQTAAPVVLVPANGSVTNNRTVTVSGTAPANSTVNIFIGVTPAGSTTASASGTFSLVVPGLAPDGTYTASATAQSSGFSVSASSNVNTFTIDGTAPTVGLSSGTVASGGTTSTSPVLFTATFSEAVTGFTSAGISVSNGTVTSGPTVGSGNSYSFQVTPTGTGTVTAQVLANAARDLANNANTASAAYSFTFAAPTITVTPASLSNGTQGTPYSVAFTAAGGSGNYTYALSGTLPSGLSFSGSTLAGTPTASGSFNFRITATDNSAAPGPYSGFRNYTLTIAAPASVAWNGSVSNDWFTAGNWTPNQVPDATIDANIPAAAAHYPVITAGTANARNLAINSGAALSQTSGALQVSGNWTNNGTFTATGGTVLLGGPSTSSILGSSTTRFWNLTTVAGAAVDLATSAGMRIQRLLTTNADLNTNGNPVTLESDATGTAMAVNPTAGFGLRGTSVTVQRYISPDLNAGLGYRHLASPTVSNTSTEGTMVSDLTTAGFSPVVNPAYNTSATPTTTAPFPTVFGYDQSRVASATNNLSAFDKGWYSPAALTDRLTSGLGYTVNLAAAQAVTFKGQLSFGDLTKNLTRNAGSAANATDAGWQLLGNPYPSPFDYSQVAPADRVNLDGAIYVFESTSQYAGNYRAYVNGVGGNPILPMGQGFFARVSAGQTSGSLTFRNAARVTTYSNPTYHRTTGTRPLIQLTLKGTGPVQDDAYVYFENGATDGFDSQYDAEKLPNTTGLNLSSIAAGTNLAVNGLPLLTAAKQVPLAVGVPVTGSYTLQVAALDNLASTSVYLLDAVTGQRIDLQQQRTYSFSASNAALITNRFSLLFGAAQPTAAHAALTAGSVGVFPNPAHQQFTLLVPAVSGVSRATAVLYNVLGQPVRDISLALPAAGARTTIDVSNLPVGVYSLRVKAGDNTVTKQVIVD